MVYDNKKEYINTAGKVLRLYVEYAKLYDYTDDIAFYAMEIAENLLTTGSTRAEAKPFYDLGIRNMPDNDLTRFKKNWESWYNCYGVFVRGIPTLTKR